MYASLGLISSDTLQCVSRKGFNKGVVGWGIGPDLSFQPSPCVMPCSLPPRKVFFLVKRWYIRLTNKSYTHCNPTVIHIRFHSHRVSSQGGEAAPPSASSVFLFLYVPSLFSPKISCFRHVFFYNILDSVMKFRSDWGSPLRVNKKTFRYSIQPAAALINVWPCNMVWFLLYMP